MRARIQLKQSTLSVSLPVLSSYTLCCSLLILPYNTYAADTLSNATLQLKSQNVAPRQTAAPELITAADGVHPAQAPNNDQPIAQMSALNFDDLEALAPMPVDQALMNEIYQVAEQAKQEAQAYRASQTQTADAPLSTQHVIEIEQADVQVDALIKSIQADRDVVVEANRTGASIGDTSVANTRAQEVRPGLFKRLVNRVRPSNVNAASQVPRISAEVKLKQETKPEGLSEQAYAQALEQLTSNIEAKLSSFTQESFADFNSALPQLRNLTNQAAQAVGFYEAEFRFSQLSPTKVGVEVTPKRPVLVNNQNIEFSGAGANQSQFRVIGVLPELTEGDIFHHGQYEVTKEKIVTAASNNGYFDAYWRLHDVKVTQPQQTADINLRYETGDRYQLAQPVFRMSDPNQDFPLDLDILHSMVVWQDGDDYTFWRVNSLANALTNSRYFNYTSVDAVIPDPVEKQLELAPDLQALVDTEQATQAQLQAKVKAVADAPTQVTQNVVDENQFAGTTDGIDQDNLARLQTQQMTQQQEKEQLRIQAKQDKKIPVLVTLNADQLNTVEAGLGYGTDTGVRFRGQYRRAIVNKRGHSFDANLELSEIRQSIDGRYSIPYKHPLNDYISLVGGYEREQRDDVTTNGSLVIESAVLGADRIIKNPRGSWQHTFGTRYRLDRLTEKGIVGQDTSQDTYAQFLSSPEQESLLFGYEVSQTLANRRVNPSKGFKQTYKAEIGSENLLTDTDIAILNATWHGLYSWGINENHQMVGRAQAGYIVVDEFKDIPYNLRYFTGGDQTIRGFDYKSLSPIADGYKIGGQALGIGSLEYNYQFKPGWRAAVFSDVGNAYDKDFSNPTEYGVGVGVRWASPIGPIRIDVASGISDDGHPIRVHFFIGSAL